MEEVKDENNEVKQKAEATQNENSLFVLIYFISCNI